MAIALTSIAAPPLTVAEAVLIPSRTLPLASQLAHLLQEFTTLSLSLFQALSSTTTVATQPIYTQISLLDRKLVAVLSLVEEHRRNARTISRLVASLQATDESWRLSTGTLHSALSQLSPILTTGTHDRGLIAASATAREKEVLTPDTVLAYARLLAKYTSAPPLSLYPLEERKGTALSDPTGRGLPGAAIPPFPTEGVMRRGRLQFAGDDAMGEIGEVGERQEELAPAPHQPVVLDSAAKLEQHARHLEQGAGASSRKHEREEEDFDFDLDLNPDL